MRPKPKKKHGLVTADMARKVEDASVYLSKMFKTVLLQKIDQQIMEDAKNFKDSPSRISYIYLLTLTKEILSKPQWEGLSIDEVTMDDVFFMIEESLKTRGFKVQATGTEEVEISWQ